MSVQHAMTNFTHFGWRHYRSRDACSFSCHWLRTIGANIDICVWRL